MRTSIFKWIGTLCLLLAALSVRAQIVDSATQPVLQSDLAKQTARLVSVSGVQLVEATQMDQLAEFTEEWVIMNDSIQEGLRQFGKDYNATEKNDSTGVENDSTDVDRSAFEKFWIVKGLWNEIRQMVSLYGDYMDGFDKLEFVVGALQTETVDVFITQGYNTIEVFNNMMGILKDQSSAHPQMSVRQCFTKGEDLKKQVRGINKVLKWQMLRVRNYSAMNNTLDPFNRFNNATKGPEGFDPAKLNQMK